jgi:hypothetical protein
MGHMNVKSQPDSKFTLELKQDGALLFMFLNSKTGRQKIVNQILANIPQI